MLRHPHAGAAHGRNIMHRCGLVADKAVAAVTASMQETIDDLTVDKEALEATTEVLQTQVQHWHDIASNFAAAAAGPPAAATPEDTAKKIEAEFSSRMMPPAITGPASGTGDAAAKVPATTTEAAASGSFGQGAGGVGDFQTGPASGTGGIAPPLLLFILLPRSAWAPQGLGLARRRL